MRLSLYLFIQQMTNEKTRKILCSSATVTEAKCSEIGHGVQQSYNWKNPPSPQSYFSGVRTVQYE
ncbi:hypothetical protein LINGRAPRIM_LOCUS2395 [Linum grandiflorum]